MEQGFALAWMGWQWDVPEQPGLLRLRAPVATAGGRPIEGLVRSVVIVGEKKDEAPLADSSHLAYPPVDTEGRDSRLYVRDHRLDAPRLLPRKTWRFAGPSKVVLAGGFEPGRIYEVVYRSRDPRVAGCGFAATRDLVSFFKNEASAANPLAGVTLAVGHGISQSGRFLRHSPGSTRTSWDAVFDGVPFMWPGPARLLQPPLRAGIWTATSTGTSTSDRPLPLHRPARDRPRAGRRPGSSTVRSRAGRRRGSSTW
jgi:hypothetical protein